MEQDTGQKNITKKEAPHSSPVAPDEGQIFVQVQEGSGTISLAEQVEQAESADDIVTSVSLYHASTRRVRGKASVQQIEKKPPMWLTTFSDIMALMLTFFVLLYSMSTPKTDVWKKMSTGLTQGISTEQAPKWYTGGQDTINIDKLNLAQALNLDYLRGLITVVMKDNPVLKNVIVTKQADQMILSLPSDLLFDTGGAEMSLEGKKALFALGGVLSRIRNRIEVIGHADPRPISGGAFSSNWALSLARAASVAGVLETVGYARPMIVRGLSNARYNELPANMDEQQKNGLSRRVDIVIMKDDGARGLFKVGG